MKQGFRKLLGFMGMGTIFSPLGQTEGQKTEEREVRRNYYLNNPIYIPTRSQKIKSKRLAKRNAGR